MKVLHLIDSGGLYGAEKMLLALMAEQKKLGLEPIVLSCGAIDEAPKPLEIAAQDQNLAVIPWRMKPGMNVIGMFKIIAWAKRNKIDVLHSHGYKFNVLLGLAPKFLLKPFNWVVTVHGYIPAKPFSKSYIYQFLDRKMSRRSNHLCLVSPAMLAIEEFRNLKNSSVILNGISSAAFSSERRQHNNSLLRLLVVGRLSEEKGILFLLEALAQLRKDELANISLTIMGEGPLKSLLLQNIEMLKLSDYVELKGFVDEPVRYFSQYDALVMPSLTEGIPITLLEALREGLPVIASRVGGIPYVLGDDYKYLVEPANAKLLVESIRTFSNEAPDYLVKLAEQNNQRFLQKFTAENMSGEYLNVYKMHF